MQTDTLTKPGKIVGLEGLIKALNLVESSIEYVGLINRLDISPADLAPFCTWNDKHYTRNQIARTNEYELSVICWEEGQAGFIHDYDSHRAWIKPIQGMLREERFLLDKKGKLHNICNVCLGPTEFSFMQAGIDIHRYSNIHPGRSISLHLYAGPVDHWNVYNQTDGIADRKVVTHDRIFKN